MVRPRWIGCSNRFWYPHESADGIVYTTVDAATDSRAPSFDHIALAAALRDGARKDGAADRLPLSSLSIGEDGTFTRIARCHSRTTLRERTGGRGAGRS